MAPGTPGKNGVDSMGKLGRIVRMEFLLTVASKLFIILTLLGPIFIASITLLPTLLSTLGGGAGSQAARIALVGADPGFLQAVSPAFRQSRVEVSAFTGSITSLEPLVRAGTYDGYVVIPADLSAVTRLQYVSQKTASPVVTRALQGVIGGAIVARRLEKAGVPGPQAASLMQPLSIETRQLLQGGGDRKSPDFVSTLTTGLTFAMLLYMTIILYGQVIGRSVLTEKTNKTVEIMLSSVRPMDLLFGKILGRALASLVQYGFWVVVSAAALKLIGPHLGVSIGAGLSPGTLACLVLFFVLAFFLYCSLYAALGAASVDEQHLAQLAWPMIVFLLIPVMMISPIITAPQSPVIVGLSFFPLTAPIVMFLRILVGAAPLLEILVSVGMIVWTTVVVVWLSARIFRVGILMTGKRFTFAEVLRLARLR